MWHDSTVSISFKREIQDTEQLKYPDVIMSLTSLNRVANYCSVVVWGSILMGQPYSGMINQDSQIVFKELSFIVKHTEVNSRRRYQSGFYKGTLVQCAGNTSKRALEMHKYLIIL